MTHARLRAACALVALCGAPLAVAVPASAQGVIVDQGHFVIRVDGREIGAEDFVIRRAGLGSGDALFASGVVIIDAPEHQEIRPLLRVEPLSGAGEEYQVNVAGTDAAEIRLGLPPPRRRYVATIRSAAGTEDREFQYRPDTRIIELGVAHHYYFLRGEREGRDIYVLEPRSRRQLVLRAGPTQDEELRLGPNVVSARRVTFAEADDGERIVWYDRQGRVLRVEIPATAWVAERTDLVG
jgi:hypothetical protein